MSKTLLAALIAFATLGGAQASDDVQITERKMRDVRDAEFETVRGRYLMSDGRLMDVTRRGRVVVVDLDGEEQTTLRALRPLDMHSTNGRMSLRFTPGSGSEMDVVVTLYTPSRRVAQVLTSKSGS